jgi:hypothetical protein
MQEGWELVNKVLDIRALNAAKVTQFYKVLAKKIGVNINIAMLILC